MIIESTIYLITRCNGIKVGLILFGTFTIAIALFTLFVFHMTETLTRRRVKWGFFVVGVSVIICALSIFIPTTKEMAAIKIIPMIAQDKQVRELPKKIVDLADEWIDEMRPQKGKGGDDDDD